MAEYDALKWALGVAFSAGVAYATVHSSQGKVEILTEKVAGHDIQFASLTKDVSYIRESVDDIKFTLRQGRHR